MEAKEFELGDILAVATGYNVSRRGLDGIYDVIGFMINDPFVSTIGLAITQKDVSREIYRQHPQLLDSRVLRKFQSDADVMDWLEAQEAKHGKTLVLHPMSVTYEPESDASYVARVNPAAKFIQVVVDGQLPSV